MHSLGDTMSKKKQSKPISISLDLHQRILEQAGRHGLSYSAFMCECAEAYLDHLEEECSPLPEKLRKLKPTIRRKN